MPRSRNIKPGFFKNEQLTECSAFARLLFAGLWTLADCRGIVEDRPKRIKMELFPADDVDVDGLLTELAEQGLVERVPAGHHNVLYMPGFQRHQNPHQREQPSELPWPDYMSTVQAPDKHGASHDTNVPSPADSLNLNPEPLNLNPESGASDDARSQAKGYPDEFEQAWGQYPKRDGSNPKRQAFKAWNARRKEGVTSEQLEQAVANYAAWVEAKGKAGTETVMQGARFFGPNEEWCQDWTPPKQQKTNEPTPSSWYDRHDVVEY